MKHVSIFANPSAGRGKSSAIAVALAEALGAAGFLATVTLDAPNRANRARFSGADAAIVIGGDGTLRAVVQRYLDEKLPLPLLLPVPMGTANLMGRHLGVAWRAGDRVTRIVESIRRSCAISIDLATANGRVFLLMAGIGIDAKIVHELDRIRKGPIQYASYLLPAALALTQYEFSPLNVRIDGSSAVESRPAMAFVGNVREYGTGFPMLPDARPDDGLLDVCVIPVKNRAQIIEQFLSVMAGEHLQGEGVVFARGKRIEIASSRPVAVQIDGDAAGHTPVDIAMLAVQAKFIVPV